MAEHSTLDGVLDTVGADAALRVAMLSLERSSDSIYWFDNAGRVVYANQTACRALGYSLEEMLGLLITDINPTYSTDASKWRAALDDQADNGNGPIPPWLKALLVGSAGQTYETVHRLKDGRLLPVEVSAAPIEIGDQRYFAAATRDVSSRRWMESAIRNAASETDKLFEVSLEMLCITDLRGAFRRVNPSWERVLGFTPAELTARPLFDRVHLDDRSAALDAFKQLGQQAGVVTFASRFEKKSGGHLWLQWRCVPEGEKIYAAVRDVTSRQAVSEAMDVAKVAAEAAAAPCLAAAATEKAAPVGVGALTHAPRVLVVDDNRLNQRVARQMLEHLGIEVETAEDGREAVESMRRGPSRFDAILMDMQMPEMDGLQATRVIRREFPKHAVPIIAATASVDGTDMNDCLDAGMNDYVPKPIEPRQLERVLSRWVTLPGASASARTDGEAIAVSPAAAGAATPLKGVDVAAALVRLNGQHDLLVRLLRVFAEEHGQTTAEIASAMAKGDFDGALRIVHNLKGVAGTLSATAVFEAARALETGLRQGQRVSLPGMVDRLGAALEVVCQSVSEWDGGARSTQTGEANREPDRPLAAALIAELDTLLKSRRFSARPRFEQLKEQLRLPELAPSIEQMQRCLDRLDFQQARQLLPSIAAALGVPFPRT